MIGGALLRPATAPPPLFLLPSTFGGGASELGSGVSAVVVGTGVEVSSDDLSIAESSGGAMDGVGSSFGVGNDAADGLGAWGNCTSTWDGKLRVTILVLRDDFGVALAEDDMLGGMSCRGMEVDVVMVLLLVWQRMV